MQSFYTGIPLNILQKLNVSLLLPEGECSAVPDWELLRQPIQPVCWRHPHQSCPQICCTKFVSLGRTDQISVRYGRQVLSLTWTTAVLTLIWSWKDFRDSTYRPLGSWQLGFHHHDYSSRLHKRQLAPVWLQWSQHRIFNCAYTACGIEGSSHPKRGGVSICLICWHVTQWFKV